MAPVFGDSGRPRRKEGGTAFNSEKPVFTFNTQSSSPQSNGFFRNQDPPIAQHQLQISTGDDGWDMSEDGSDDAEMEDTSLYQDDDASPMDLLRPELSAFAERLEASGLFQSSADESSGSSIDLIGEFQTYAAEHVDAAAHAVEQLEDLGEEEDDGQCADELFEARELLKYWEMEHQTWELFGTLITHRIGTEGRIPEDIPPELDDKFASDVSIREYFFEADPTFRELTIVLQWLRRYAPGSTVDEIENDRLYRGDRGWMYTKEKIKATKRMRPGKQLSFKLMPASNQNIVTELDPDAPSRQRAQLEEEDGAWERYLMKLVWGFLRKGQFTIARDLCVDAGEFWRAASITGAKHVWDPKIDGSRDIEGLDDEEKLDEEDDDEYSVKGNRNRELWKRMCFAVARRQGGEIYEKAVYGILCGDVESVLPVCQTWEDLLFAHVNSLVEGYYSSKLAELSRTPGGVASFPFFDSIAYHTRGRTLLDDKTVIPRIIDEISANRHIPDAGLPLRAIQGSLISSRFHDLVVELDRQLRLFEEVGPDYDCRADERSRGLDALEPRLLRVVVHMIMVLQSLDANFQVGASYHSAAENVIAGYISTLGEFGKYDLVPIYASRLSPEKAIAVVGKSLAFFHGDDSQRDALIESMDRHEIDVDGCLKTAMRQSLDMTSHEYVPSAIIEHGLIFKGFTDEIRDEDRQLIRGLEWLMLGSEALREEIVQKGCEVYKRFLLTGRLSSAKLLFDTVKLSDIPTPEENDASEKTNESSVYMHMESLIAAMVALDKWRQALSDQPERIQDRSYARKLKPLYETVLQTLPDVVKSFLGSQVLLSLPFIPEIRRAYVPEMVLSLHRVHVEAGRWIYKGLLRSALDLAADVADPDRTILDTFIETGRLEEYVDEIAAVSRVILGAVQEGTKDGKDQLGIWSVAK